MAVKQRIKRDYRRSAPAKFLSFCRKVKHGLTENPHYPEAMWGANISVLRLLFEKVDLLEVVYHQASNGDRILIQDRDKLKEEMVVILDELALLLEAASVRNTGALMTTGFTVTLERRSSPRPRQPLGSPVDFSVLNSGEPRRAVGSAAAMPGAFNHEIHMNTNDPSQEQDWVHKGVYPNVGEMVLDNLQPGNTFFRMRHHGPEGPGPWSAVTSVTIS